MMILLVYILCLPLFLFSEKKKQRKKKSTKGQ